MPDDRPQNSVVQIVSLVINCIQTIVIAWLSIQANQTHDVAKATQEATQEVRATQEQSAQTTQEVKTALDVRAKKIDKESEEQRKATASMLYANWKYLDGIAEMSGLPKDKEEAANAKRRLDEFSAKK